ncbi:hypothetical protein OPV22_004304 [Ensete ventricosum]|uniref:Uncharacterized protein n=1 Tax=Ensete ventricosum TaxID=4639 RepID=A0AAV8S321_ENSVE|nr:hypothetical protein OPV22_004304 [Ensete ventricosum]
MVDPLTCKRKVHTPERHLYGKIGINHKLKADGILALTTLASLVLLCQEFSISRSTSKTLQKLPDGSAWTFDPQKELTISILQILRRNESWDKNHGHGWIHHLCEQLIFLVQAEPANVREKMKAGFSSVSKKNIHALPDLRQVSFHSFGQGKSEDSDGGSKKSSKIGQADCTETYMVPAKLGLLLYVLLHPTSNYSYDPVLCNLCFGSHQEHRLVKGLLQREDQSSVVTVSLAYLAILYSPIKSLWNETLFGVLHSFGKMSFLKPPKGF